MAKNNKTNGNGSDANTNSDANQNKAPVKSAKTRGDPVCELSSD